MWLKNAWDAVAPSIVERCFVKCGFVDTAIDTTTDKVPISSDMDSFVTHGGITWQEFADCNSEVATCETLEDN